MASTTAIVFSVLAGVIALLAAYVYLFGIPPELKREMQEQALKTMGENKASYIMKDQMDKIPDSDQQDVKELKGGLKNAVGGGLNNPLGKAGGDAADDLTRGMRE
ncbi:hypothetical protein BDY21DRAFT_178398 [Lineolata rhizophorae]|uniref:Uncharacterized protein n=1 Tax=Lineolata rhizophorae TaxID=578093 RepID=A0A6A6P7L2_9PEZI|nr:hypothetical protein BDY21DRAFT_178398 [Lineolata rhizophorae]